MTTPVSNKRFTNATPCASCLLEGQGTLLTTRLTRDWSGGSSSCPACCRVTLRDVYHCGIDKDLLARNIEQAQTYAADMGDEWISFAAADDLPHIADLDPSAFARTRLTTPASARRRTRQRSRS